MWGNRNDFYVEWLSATNAHKSEGFELPPVGFKKRRLHRAAKCHKRSDKNKDFQTVRHSVQLAACNYSLNVYVQVCTK